jgi:hypothetical protein
LPDVRFSDAILAPIYTPDTMKSDKTGLRIGERGSAKKAGKSRFFGTECFSMKRAGYNSNLSFSATEKARKTKRFRAFFMLIFTL